MDKVENLKSFFEEYTDDFYDYLDNIKVNLRKTNSEYIRLYKEYYKILEDYPNLQKIIDEEKLQNGLSTAECTAISNLLNIHYDLQDIVEKEIFFKGGFSAYCYFRKMGIV